MFGSTIQKMRIPFRQLKCRQAKIHMMTIETCCFPKSHIISPDIGNEIRLQIDLILPVIFYITRKVVLSGFFSDTFFEVDYRTRGMLKIAQFKWFMQHLNIWTSKRAVRGCLTVHPHLSIKGKKSIKAFLHKAGSLQANIHKAGGPKLIRARCALGKTRLTVAEFLVLKNEYVWFWHIFGSGY